MKRLIRSILFFAVFLFTTHFAYAEMEREKINFNRKWQFKLGDYSGAEKPDYDTTDWEEIGLPHSFSMPYFLSPDFYVGYGWYIKTFDIPEDYRGKRIYIEFEAAFQHAEIYINGHEAGEHKGGYTGFQIDITDYVKTGENLIAVRLNNLWDAQLAPRAGEHVFSGGIYRDVYLVITNPVHVDWYGTFVTTHNVSTQSAAIEVATDIKNSSEKDANVHLVTEVVSPNGEKLIDKVEEKLVKKGELKQFHREIGKITNPLLWSPETPYLYKAVSKVYIDNKLIDTYETTFGIRWFEWTADKGFFLNGEHYYIRGANVHQDHAGWGDAVTNAGFYRDLKLIKEAGFNLVRGSHYPHDPAFSQACDELGLLFWAENAFWGTGGFSKSDGYWNSSAYPIFGKDRDGFESSVKKQLAELIRIHRNHPSIVIWSMSNEPFFTAPETMDNMKKLLKETVELTHKLDPTRPAAIGGAQRPLGDARIDKIGDVAGYNGDGGVLPDFQNPGIPNFVSEYGSTTANRPGNYIAGWGDLAKNGGQNGFPWRSGQAIWCAFDHGSIAGSRLGKMGIIDYFRLPKRSWYWYRNEYMNIPPPQWAEEGIPAKLKLEADKTENILTDGTDDVMLTITVLDKEGKHISNNPSVTLEIIRGGGEFPTGRSITFEEKSDISILDGQAAIELRSYYAGETVVRASSKGLEPVEIKINFVGEENYIEGTTPKVKERPYVRFSKAGQPNILQTFGQNNPTFPSSSAAGHAGGLATDGNKETSWKPASDDKNPEWILDTERGLSFAEIKIFFPEPTVYYYTIEVSKDKEEWQLVSDKLSNTKEETEVVVPVPSHVKGRFVKVSFPESNTVIPQIAEVEVKGIVIDE